LYRFKALVRVVEASVADSGGGDVEANVVPTARVAFVTSWLSMYCRTTFTPESPA
jgi:hypothetical protein